MSVLQASNNGGRINTVHNQTDDGSVFSVFADGEYVPISFKWVDYLGTCQEAILAAGEYHHDHLMRGDCGVREESDDSAITFAWDVLEERIDGFSTAPSNEFLPSTSQHRNKASCVKLCDADGHMTRYYRKDRSYWTPGATLKATKEEDMFGMTQWNPMSCDPDPQDNCGNYILKGDKRKC